LTNNPINHKTHAGFSLIDVAEIYGLPFHLATAFQYLVIAERVGPRALQIKRAIWYLQRWLDDVHDNVSECDATDDALVWASPQKIVAAFGLNGDIAVAATYILNAAAFADDEELEIAKAIIQLERAEQEAVAA